MYLHKEMKQFIILTMLSDIEMHKNHSRSSFVTKF